MIFLCHRTFIWCLVIVVIQGNVIPVQKNLPKPQNIVIHVEWDEDPNRWDEEIQIVNPSSLIVSNNVSVESPHFEPLISAIDFGRNNFDEEAKNKGKEARNEYNSLSYGDKISASNVINNNRRRNALRTKDVNKDTETRKRSRGLNRHINADSNSKKTKKNVLKQKPQESTVSDITLSSEQTNDIKTDNFHRNDIKNEERLKNHRLDSYDSSYESSNFDGWPDIYNMFPDIETAKLEFDPGLFVDPFYNPGNNFNERIDDDFLDYSTYDYKDYPFEKIDTPTNSIEQNKNLGESDDLNYTPNTYIDFTNDLHKSKKFIPSLQIDPLFVPSRKIPFNVDKVFLSQAIQYTEKPKTEGNHVGNADPGSAWKLSFPNPASFPSSSLSSSPPSFSQEIPNSLSNHNIENPRRHKKNTFSRPRFPLNEIFNQDSFYTSTSSPELSAHKISSSTLRYKENKNKNVDLVVSTNKVTHPSRKPQRKKQNKQPPVPIQSKIRQNNIPPPPLPPLRPKPARKKIDFKVGFDKLSKLSKKLIRSIKLKRRRKLRKHRKGDGRRRKRKLRKPEIQNLRNQVKNQIPHIPYLEVAPYLRAPGLPNERPKSISNPKRRRKRLRRKNAIGQRRMADDGGRSTKPNVSPRSIAHGFLDGLNRAARFSSEIILYTSLLGLT